MSELSKLVFVFWGVTPSIAVLIDEQEKFINMTKGNVERSLPQVIAALTAAGGALVAGTVLGWTSLIKSEITDKTNPIYGFPVDEAQFSWLGSITNLGAAFMCIPTGFLTQWIGRKWTMLSLVIPLLIGWALITFASNFVMLLIGRFLLGMGSGGFCVASPMYTGEISSKKIRGTLGSFFQLMITIGILIAYILGGYTPLKAFNIICLVLPAIFFGVFVFMPESPTYLISKGKEEEAVKAIKWLRGSQYEHSSELQELKEEDTKTKLAQENQWKALAGTVAFRSIIIGLGLMFFQQLSGINAVIFYSGTIFDLANTGMSTKISTLVIGIVQVLATFVSTLIVDKAGRKLLLITSAIAMAICTILLGVYFYLLELKDPVITSIAWLPLASLTIFIIMFSIGFGPVPWLMMGEIFSPEIKSLAGSFAGTTNWLLAFVVTKAYDPLNQSIGGGPTFWIFSAITILGVFFVIFVTPETKGKSLAEVQEVIAKSSNRSPTQNGQRHLA